MAFSKHFPKTERTGYTKWVEITLNDEEEKEVEQLARQENIKLFSECLEDAEKIASSKNFKPYQTDIISIASSLFEKRASHLVYFKEKKSKEKFDTI